MQNLDGPLPDACSLHRACCWIQGLFLRESILKVDADLMRFRDPLLPLEDVLPSDCQVKELLRCGIAQQRFIDSET